MQRESNDHGRRTRLALALSIGLAAIFSSAGCLDSGELTAPSFETDLGVPYDDTGRAYDPRRPNVPGDTGRDAGHDDTVTADVGDVDGGQTTECDDARPCPSPFVCVDGACQPECEVATDCDDGFVCTDFQCIEPECVSDLGCDLLDEVCADGVCAENPCNLVLFTYDPGGATHTTVHVAGEFNAAPVTGQWPETVAAGGWPLRFSAELGLWWGKFEVDNGVYAYRIVLNESDWNADPGNPDSIPSTIPGEADSLLTVDCSDTPVVGACGDLEAFDWRDTVMYFAMVDRFFDSDGRADAVSGASDGPANGPSGQYEGGDLAGVTEQMEYLADLGVTALWLSAPYDNRDGAGAAIDPAADSHMYSGYHGYWPSPGNVDYSDPDDPTPVPAVEDRIGTAADLQALVAAAHGADSANDQGIKVLFDYVMNHVDRDSGLFAAHPDWFATREGGGTALCGPENLWEDPYWGTRCAFTDYLPPFDFDNAAARAWSVDDALWWAREYGIDGYRLDAIKHVPLSWLTDLRARLNSEFSDPVGGRFYLVGETFAYDDRDLIGRFIDPTTMLDGQFDFPFKARLCEALFSEGGNLADFAGWMTGNDSFYGPGALMTTWIGNHDIPRAIHFASRQIGNCREGSHAGNGWNADAFPQPGDSAPYERLGLAFVVMMTNPGIPLIYYGDEIGLAGGGDPDNRRTMVFDDGALSAAQRSLRETVAVAARIRAENPVLARGRRINRSATRDTWVYSLVGCGADSPDVTVAINRSDAPTSVDVPAGEYLDLFDGSEVSGSSFPVSARGWRILRRR